MTPAVAAVAGAPPSDHTAAALHHGPHGHPTAGFSPAAAAAAYQGRNWLNHIDLTPCQKCDM